MRAVLTQSLITRDMMMENIPVPATMINKVTITILGKALIISVIRIITMSTLPP